MILNNRAWFDHELAALIKLARQDLGAQGKARLHNRLTTLAVRLKLCGYDHKQEPLFTTEAGCSNKDPSPPIKNMKSLYWRPHIRKVGGYWSITNAAEWRPAYGLALRRYAETWCDAANRKETTHD